MKDEPVSVLVNVKVTEVTGVGLAGSDAAPIVVLGALVSTVNLRSGVVNELPAASVTRTANVWAPSPSDPVVCGDEHPLWNVPSTAHSTFVGVPPVLNVNCGVGSLVGVGSTGPPVIDAVGAWVSIVQV